MIISRGYLTALKWLENRGKRVGSPIYGSREGFVKLIGFVWTVHIHGKRKWFVVDVYRGLIKRIA